MVDKEGRVKDDPRPIVGIVQNYSPNLFKVLKELRPDIRLEFNLSGQKDWSQQDIQLLQTAHILVLDGYVMDRYKLWQQIPKVQWIQSLWDGVDKIVRDLDPNLPRPEYIVTRNGGFFGQQLSEYVLGQIIARDRHFYKMKNNQQNKIWFREGYKSAYERTIGIIGLGDIGKQIAKVAKAFSMTVWAVVRTMPSDQQKCTYVDEYREGSKLSEMLSSCDYICCVLPSTPQTDGLLDGQVLSACKDKKSVLINVGRGNIVKDSTILHALNEGWLGGAILDVMETEPLPESSPLWTHPEVTMTPHIAGLVVDDAHFLQTFLTNYDKFLKGEKMDYVVDWDKGY